MDPKIDQNKGVLFVIATPIGNLDDISMHAINTISEVDIILSEDTRETQKVLQKYKLQKSLIPYNDQSHEKILPTIMNYLDQGKNVALISDNGTPTISDPGFKLVRYLTKKNYPIYSIPGPSACISALSISGLPTDKFCFLGFLPKSDLKKQEVFSQYGNLDCTLIIYESCYRIKNFLEFLERVIPDRYLCVIKDHTKKFELKFVGIPSEILSQDYFKNEHFKGEYVIMIAKKGFDLYGK